MAYMACIARHARRPAVRVFERAATTRAGRDRSREWPRRPAGIAADRVDRALALHRDCPIACRRCGATRRRTAPPAGIGVDIGVIIECMVPPFAFRIFGAAIPAIVSAARRG
ncbi:hypothetical protein AQ749_27720 [Burkholderia pseudomallei]|nr:hypothetical protein AQ737_23040 [Burkholderia pseudomallei]OMS56704.1 hypothetical protein AQ742_16280 [Burkholderia pseudomallei]OMS93779.1 hypothetical protein AQ749_27720 [Burkholderia pseudomallei]OMT82735.1 hypothetical protein AQ764_16165 [Burkholderia pseudomallei]ONA12191.1 hypothetical protein AQ877_03580 [Burkholderia pseudomallei]